MKSKLLCIMLAAAMISTAAVPAFAADSGSVKNQETATGSSVTTAANSASTTTDTANSVSTTTDTAITAGTTTEEGITVKEPLKKLSLNEALKIMTTTGTRAETANLNKQSDMAVAKGYSEKYSDIKKALNDIDYLESLPLPYQQAALAQLGASSIVELAYDAQVAGATENNKKIMALRRNFANNNTENNYQADLNQIRQDTINIYNTVLLAEDNYKIAKDNLKAQQRNLQNVLAKKEVGLLTKKDVLQAQSALTDAEKEVRAAKTKMEYARMSFNYLLGYHVLQEVEFTDKLTESTGAAIDTEKAVKNALDNRNEIRGADFAKDIYKILFDDIAAYPKTSATYLNAQIKYLNAEKTAKDARAQIEIDIRNKAAEVADKKAALDAARSLQSYAQEGLRLITLTNEEGLSTVEELLTAQVNLYKANLNVAKATSEYNLALEAYLNAQGVGTMRIPL
jgi:hypothetical protein